MLNVVAVVAMSAVAIFLGISTYLLHSIRRHHVAVIANLKEINRQYMLGFEIVTAEMQKIEGRIKVLEDAGA